MIIIWLTAQAQTLHLNYKCRGADKTLARLGRKQATANKL